MRGDRRTKLNADRRAGALGTAASRKRLSLLRQF